MPDRSDVLENGGFLRISNGFSLREFIQCARKILDYFKQKSENGLVRFPGWNAVDTPDWKPGDKGWDFIDWGD